MKIPRNAVFSKKKPNEKRKEDCEKWQKQQTFGALERERERVLLKNRCFAKSILFVVPGKKVELKNKAQVNNAKEIENKKENIERTRMDYSIDMLKNIFMLI